MTAQTLTPAGAARKSGLRQATGDAGVIWLGLFAMGIGLGALVTSQGLPWWLAPLLSGAVFAGSVEFLLVDMVAGGATITAIAVTTALVNCRHLFYGLSFPLHRVSGRAGRAYSVFALNDESFAILSSKDPATLTSARILWTQAGMHVGWVCGSLLGALLGASVLADLQGLDFILTALFVVLFMDTYRANPDRVTVVLAAAAGVVAAILVPGSMLVVAMGMFAASLAVRHHRLRHRRGPA